MAQLFISYSRTDRETIEKLSAVLEAVGHSVWWDRHIRGGASFSKDIETQLEKADVVIVGWSSTANKSDWVKDEAVYARDKGKLIPICLTLCEAPMGFRQYQMLDFAKWKGDPASEPVHDLLSAIAEISHSAAPERLAPAPKSFFERVKTEPTLMAGAVGTLVLVAALVAFLFTRMGGDEQLAAGVLEVPLTAPSEVSIAVLPFADMSPEGNQEYFADGLSEELLNVLVRVDGLKVASRTSSFAFKNEILSIGEIAERLKVNHVLEGSVRKMDSRIRITAQLIDARTDRHVWSQTYDRHLSDIFRIQDEIATAVVDALRDQLGMSQDEEINIPDPIIANLTAYDAYLKARELYLMRGKANVAESMRLFEHAVEIDPKFARGWEGLAGVYAIATSWGIYDKDYSAMALVAAERALTIDPDLSAPYAVIGLTYRTHYPTPWVESMDNLEKAIERDPKVTDPRLWLGMDYLAVGELRKAIEIFDGCLELDASAKLCRKYRSLSYLALGDFDTAMIDANINAEDGYYRDFDAYLPFFLERGDRLLAFTVSRTVNWWGDFPHREFIAAVENPENQPADRIEKFRKWGESKNVKISSVTNLMLTLRAYDEVTIGNFNNDYEQIWLPQYAHYRKSPQFKRLANDLGITAYWRDVGFPPQCRALSEDDFECD